MDPSGLMQGLDRRERLPREFEPPGGRQRAARRQASERGAAEQLEDRVGARGGIDSAVEQLDPAAVRLRWKVAGTFLDFNRGKSRTATSSPVCKSRARKTRASPPAPMRSSSR